MNDAVVSWYWASFRALLERAEQQIAELPTASLDRSLADALAVGAADSVQRSPYAAPTWTPTGIRDRRRIAAFGAHAFACGHHLDAREAHDLSSALAWLLRQNADDPDGWLSSPRLMLGIVMAARLAPRTDGPASTANEVNSRLERRLRQRGLGIREQLLLGFGLSLLPSTHGNPVQRNIDAIFRTVIAQPDESLSDRDAVAITWADTALASLMDSTLRAQVHDRAAHLTGRLPNLDVTAFDALDWGMLKAALDVLARKVGTNGAVTAMAHVRAVVDSFTDIALKLAARRKGKRSFPIDDEYDVQDILYAVLRPYFPDLEVEDPAPKDMASSKRTDLVSIAASMVFEVKIVKAKQHATKVFDEIKVDVESYHTHPACQNLIIFIYDPNKLIPSARQRETDFSGLREVRPGRRIDVALFIRP